MNDNLYSPGDSLRHSFIVQPEDVAAFEGKVVHEVCATFTLAREVEFASRQFVLIMKSEEEEGIGTEVTIKHKAPAFVGEEVVIEAVINFLTAGELNCTYTASVGDRLIAEGTTGQKVFSKENLKKHFNRLKEKRN